VNPYKSRPRPRGRPAKPTSALVPAGARETVLPDLEAVLHTEAIEVFAKAVGGRDELAQTLAVAGTGSEVERITTLLLDPRYASWSLARLCKMVGLSVAELFTVYRKASIAKAHVEASRLIAKKLRPVVDDVMTRAAPQRRLCSTCLGTSQAAGAEPCLPCDSTGYVWSEPDLDRQKLALELGQLLEKKGGLIVQQTTTLATLGASAGGSLEQLQQAVGDLLFGERGSGEVIEAAAIPPQPAPDDDDDEDDDDEDEEDPDETEPELPFEQPDSPPSSPRRPERSEPDPDPSLPIDTL
jgi:hypothetical protein